MAGGAAAGAGGGGMFALNRTTRVFLKVGVTDLRLGFDGLYGQVVSILRQDVLSGHVFAAVPTNAGPKPVIPDSSTLTFGEVPGMAVLQRLDGNSCFHNPVRRLRFATFG